MPVGRVRVAASVLAGAMLLTAWTAASPAVAGDGQQPQARVSGSARVNVMPWSPQPGVIFNNPLRDTRAHVINKKIRTAIEATKTGQTIRLVTWNLKSKLYTRAIVNAHKRGVGVRVLMSAGLAAGQSSEGSYATIKRALSRGNKARPPRLKSWVRVCNGSCRGRHGIVHSKYFLFSQVGLAQDIVMSASANLTEVAANRQWNDLTTIVNRPKVYDNFLEIFNQAAQDKPHKPTYHQFRDGDLVGWFFPRMGRSDIVLNLLRPVACRGARNSGIHHRTSIRIAQAVFNGERGLNIARRLKGLYNQGCNIRIVYTAMANKSRQVLSGVPKQHIVQDFDGDGLYDRYLHIKAIAISGHYGTDHSHRVVLNGSSNWSGMSLKSDEQGLILTRDAVVDKYGRWVDFLFQNPPPQPPPPPSPTPAPTGRAAMPKIDPYAHVEMD